MTPERSAPSGVFLSDAGTKLSARREVGRRTTLAHDEHQAANWNATAAGKLRQTFSAKISAKAEGITADFADVADEE
jgi:hypothetical protein